MHLLLIYGNFSGFSFRNWADYRYGYGEVFLATAVLLLVMYGLALWWEWIKQKGERWRRGVQLATLVILVLVFLFGPGV